MPQISIVLPTFNGEKYLQKSVDSILAQTYTDWELIIVNDCSTDETADIINKYCNVDARIHAIHNTKNQKLPQSLNIGFKNAKGQYLTWTSDDNLYMPNAISVMAEYLDKHNDVYMVCGNMHIIDEEGKIIGQAESYSDEKMYVGNYVGACFMYRRQVRDEIGDYNIDTFCAEDYDYWLRVLDRFGKIVLIDRVLYQYRIHKESLSATRRRQVRAQTMKLSLRYINKIFNVLHDNKKELCRIYYEMRKYGYMTQEIAERFKQILPELCEEVFATNKKYIIFGAGKYGEMAAVSLGDRAAFFADNDLGKIGKIKCGLKILSYYDAARIAEDYCFLIAVAENNIYEMITQLWKAGVKEYGVFTP